MQKGLLAANTLPHPSTHLPPYDLACPHLCPPFARGRQACPHFAPNPAPTFAPCIPVTLCWFPLPRLSAALIVTSQVDGYLRSLQHLQRTGSFPRPPASAVSRPGQLVVDVFPQVRQLRQEGCGSSSAWPGLSESAWPAPCPLQTQLCKKPSAD